MLKLAKKGMLAKTIYEPEVAINGLCFCNNCGYQWMGRKEFKFIKKEELNQEKKNRETEQYAELIKKQLKEKYRSPSSLI